MTPQSASYSFKVVLVGDGACGKTSLVDRYMHGRFKSEYRMSIGMQPSLKRVKLENDRIASLSIWDIAGQDRFRFIRKTFFRGASAALMVYDVTRPKTLSNLETWNKDLRCGASGSVIKILIGNKVDLVDLRQVSGSDAEMTKDALDWREYIETSALTGERVDDAFQSIAKELAEAADKRFHGNE